MQIKRIILIIILSVSFGISHGQELSGLTKKEPFSLSGGVSVNSVLYHTLDSLSSKDPFTYVFTGNLNLSVYEIINCPISFTYSNYNENFSHPFNFNQFGIQPSYKWIKTYLGYNSMNFSSYTLSGHQFLGAGVELTPAEIPFNFSAMYGRFLKGVEEDTLNTSNTPAFARYGYAVKIGYLKNGDDIKLIIFKAHDDINSLSNYPVKSDIKPKENLVLSLIASKKLFNRLNVSAEIATSAINTDTRVSDEKNGKHIFKATNLFMQNTIATAYYKAFKTSVNYTGQSYSIGSTYERVDPGYETLGAYYFTNDYENITLDASKRLLKDKVNVNGRFGLQRNNLDKSKVSESQKIVGSLNGMWTVNQKTNANISYSNFIGYTFIRNTFDEINQTNPYQNLDTLNFTQINQNISASISYLIGNIQDKKKQQSVNFNLSIQNASSEQGEEKLPGTKFYNGNAAYSLNLIPLNLSLFSSININYNDIPEIDNQTTLGPTIGGSKSLFDKLLKLSSSVSYNTNFEAENKNRVLVFRTTGTYTLQKKHSFNLSFVTLDRTVNTGKSTDFTLKIGYKYNFKTSYNELFK